jgi:hypothetical protein
MRAKFLAAAVISSALIAVPAMAQNTNSSASENAQQQNASATGLWQGSQLIHLDVYDSQNEKIGDIKELMLDKSGKIDSVVIGVGGFLGMGERDVAVKFGDLKWSDQPVKQTNASNTGSRPGGTGTTGAGGASQAQTNRTYPDHAVLNMTKDQLKAMPQFNYNK